MSEMLVVVDENDNLIKGEDRKVVHNSNLWHRGVHIFIYNDKNELLLQLRSPTKDKFPNRWDCSVSEHVSVNEAYEDSAKRGLLEELGIKANLKELLHFRMCYGPGDNMICKIFQCNYSGPINKNEEVADLKFFTEDKLKKTLKENSELFTPWLIEHLKWKFKMPHKLEIFKENNL